MRIAEASVVARSTAWAEIIRGLHAVLGEALRVGDGVAAAAVGQREHVGRRGRAASSISNAAVFWPSIRFGLSELTSAYVPRSASSRQLCERLVEAAPHLEHLRADRARLRELRRGDAPAGHRTTAVRPARAA